MHVLILFNPVSGAGRSAAVAARLETELKRERLSVSTAPTEPRPSRHWLDPLLDETDLLVVVGGDGAMRLAAGSASRTNVPVYHFPCGTENLFAREFGMNRKVSTLQHAIQKNVVRRVDMGLANGRPFLLMASVGLDAEVVHDLSSRRGTSISHLSYALPILRQLSRWRPEMLQVTVDGHRIDQSERAFVVVANSRQYGWRINPAAGAIMDDGLLNVALFPAKSTRDLLGWLLRCMGRRQDRSPRFRHAAGREIRIVAESSLRYQVDGDPPGESEFGPPGSQDGQTLPLELKTQPGALRVLTP